MGCEEDDRVTLVFVSDRKIRELNRDFRQKNQPTDVLSFPGDRDSITGDPGHLGDVIISVETAQRQADEAEATLNEEILRLLVHGLLHLKGYRHDDAAERRKMRDRERRIIQKVSQGEDA